MNTKYVLLAVIEPMTEEQYQKLVRDTQASTKRKIISASDTLTEALMNLLELEVK